MECSAHSNVKQAMEGAQAERSQALFSGLARLFRLRKSGVAKTTGIGFSRWA